MACSQAPNGRIAARAARAVVLVATLTAAFVGAVATSPSASGIGNRRPKSTSVSLSSQTNWVTGSSMSLDVAIHSLDKRAELGLKLTVYSRLTSRYALGLAETGKQSPDELVLDATPIIPLRALRVTGTGVLGVAMHVRVATSASLKPGGLGSPRLALDCAPLDCDGVYPLVVTVVDTANNTPLASLTTFLIYVAGRPGLNRLRVALVLPLGATPVLTASGSPALSAKTIQALAAVLETVEDHPTDHVNFELYPQLLVALAESRSPQAAAVLTDLRALAHQAAPSGPAEFLEAPFTPVNLDRLTAAGLGSELSTQLAAAEGIFRSELGVAPPRGVYLSTTPIDAASVVALAARHVGRVVLPETELPAASSLSLTSPLDLSISAGSNRSSAARLTAVVADSALAAHLAPGTSPVLATHQFLADIAQTFFEEPFGAQARGVVVALGAVPSSSLLSMVLEGLASSPIARPATVASVFSAVPVGADGAPTHLAPAPDHTRPSYAFASSIESASSMTRAIDSIVPDDHAFIADAEDAVLLAETAGFRRGRWALYAAEPRAAVSRIEHDLALAGTRTVTLTQRQAKVPLTIVSVFPSPIHATLELSSGTLAIAPGDFNRPVVLAHKNSPFVIPVTARTSGVSTLTIELVSPRGGIVLFEDVYTVRSTAFSIVAVGLSVAALLVLGLWWLRSHVRRTRRRAQAPAVPGPAVTSAE